MKSEAEQSALAGAGDEEARGEIEERRGHEAHCFSQSESRPSLLTNKQASIANRGEIVRRGQAAGDLLPTRCAQDLWTRAAEAGSEKARASGWSRRWRGAR